MMYLALLFASLTCGNAESTSLFQNGNIWTSFEGSFRNNKICRRKEQWARRSLEYCQKRCEAKPMCRALDFHSDGVCVIFECETMHPEPVAGKPSDGYPGYSGYRLTRGSEIPVGRNCHCGNRIHEIRFKHSPSALSICRDACSNQRGCVSFGITQRRRTLCALYDARCWSSCSRSTTMYNNVVYNLVCKRNFYTTTDSSDGCLRCPKGQYRRDSSIPGIASKCDRCDSNYYSATGSSEDCLPCPEGLFMETGTLPDYFRARCRFIYRKHMNVRYAEWDDLVLEKGTCVKTIMSMVQCYHGASSLKEVSSNKLTIMQPSRSAPGGCSIGEGGIFWNPLVTSKAPCSPTRKCLCASDK